MNTRTSAFASLALVPLLLGSAARGDDGTTLRYKMTKGEQRVAYSKTETKQTQTVMGMSFESEFNLEAYGTNAVDEVDADGNYHISAKNNRIKVAAKLGPAGDYSFDSQSSERDKASQLGASLTPVFERMSGASIQFVMTPMGEVKELKGYTELFRDLIENNPFAAQFTAGGTDEAAKANMENELPHLPAKSVKPGDTWEVPSDLTMPKFGKVTGKRVYRYVGPDKVGDRPTAKIEATNEVSVEINSDMNGTQVTGNFKSNNATEMIQFDVAAGKVLLREGTIAMTGDLNVSVNGMNIPVHQEQTVKAIFKAVDKIPD